MPARRSVAAAAVLVAVLSAGCSSATPAATITTAASSSPATVATRSKTTPPKPAPSTAVSAKARRAGLVEIHGVVPAAIVDLRYTTSNNFTHVRLYPKSARCLVHTSMRAGLRTAAKQLRAQGYRLVFWDCYRPHSVQVRMFRVVANPEFVARPGPYARSHEAGRSVDVTLSKGGHLVSMGTGFDSFTPRAHAYATRGVSAAARAHRRALRAAMAAGGLTVYVGEWWHFDGPGADTPRPILGAPLH